MKHNITLTLLIILLVLNNLSAQQHPVFTKWTDYKGVVHQSYYYVNDAPTGQKSQPAYNSPTNDNKSYTGNSQPVSQIKMLNHEYSKGDGDTVFYYGDGSRFVGFWDNYQRDGYGKLYDEKGKLMAAGYWTKDEYIGIPVSGEPFNYGGGTYTGEWKDGKLTGHGKVNFPSGDKYEGDFVNAQSWGEGTYTWKTGRSQGGQWYNGKLNGKGHFEWPDGKKYTGDYVMNYEEGEGTMTWPGGATYTGHFVHGDRSGQGTFTDATGKKQSGIWDHDKLVGAGTSTFENIMYAIAADDIVAVKDFIAAKTNLNSMYKFEDSYTNVLKLIFKGYNGTPLGFAVASSQILDDRRKAIIELLLNSGADVNGVNAGGYTPLMLAIDNNQDGYFDLMLKHGADKKIKAKDGMTALKLAVQSKRKSWERELKK